MSIFSLFAEGSNKVQLSRKGKQGGRSKVWNEDAIEVTQKGSFYFGNNLARRVMLSEDNGVDFSVSVRRMHELMGQAFTGTDSVLLVVTPMEASPNPVLGSKKSLQLRKPKEDGSKMQTLEEALESGKRFKFTNEALFKNLKEIYNLSDDVSSFHITLSESSQEVPQILVSIPGLKEEEKLRKDVVAYEISITPAKGSDSIEEEEDMDADADGADEEVSNETSTEVELNTETANETATEKVVEEKTESTTVENKEVENTQPTETQESEKTGFNW